MLEPIIARSRTVAAILSDEYRLVLPYFQRGYAWQEQHVARLLTDLLVWANGQDAGDWYPLGTIIVAKAPEQPETWIADGHQRLITLTILIAILRDLETDEKLKSRLAACILADGREGEDAYRLTTHEAARACLRSFVQATDSTSLVPPEDAEDVSDSEANIIANRDQLMSGLTGLSPEQRRALAVFVLDRCFILVASVAEQRIARLLFSTMHDTGLKPSTTDLFKAQVLGCIDADAREECQAIWEQLEAGLGQGHFEALLRHIAIIEARAIPKEQITTTLQSRFDLDKANAAQSFVQRRLRGTGAHFVMMRDVRAQTERLPGPVLRRLQYLDWIRNHDTWTWPALHWLDQRGAGDPQTGEFMQKLEALAWINTIRAEDPSRRDARYIRLLDEIDNGRALEPGGALAISRAELQRVREVLSAPNYTNRRYRLFLLLRINASLDGDREVRNLDDATMEHILPSRPAAGSRWNTDFTPAQAAKFRNKLGNLTLLTEVEQNRVKNHDFAVKRPILAESGFSLSRRLHGQQSWLPKDIDQATADMIGILLRSWGLT